MSQMLKQYPSGVRTFVGTIRPQDIDLAHEVELVKDGDPELVEVLKRVQVHRLGNITSQDKLLLISHAKRLFNNFDQFIAYNVLKNDLIHGKDLDFLLDTVDFVNGGIRSMDMSMWINYLDQEPKKPPRLPEDRIVELNSTGANYIGKWLRQPYGFEDLVDTLTILFGIKLQVPDKVRGLI